MNVAKCVTSPQRGEAYFICSDCGKVNNFNSVKHAKSWGKQHKIHCTAQYNGGNNNE